MSRQITIFRYIASHEPSARQAKRLMEDWGYRVDFRDEAGFASCLGQFINAETRKGKGDEALIALGRLHPDRELILAGAEEVKHGIDGFGGGQQSATSSQQPVTNNQPATSNQADYTPILLLLGFLASALFLSVAIISKN